MAINVSDVPGGIAFYTETMGLVQNHTAPTSGSPGLVGHRQRPTGPSDRGPVPNNVGQHFALTFDDLGAAVAELRTRGLR